MNRDYSCTAFIVSGLVYCTLYFRQTLPVKANSGFRADLFPWFIFGTAAYVAGRAESAAHTFCDTIYDENL